MVELDLKKLPELFISKVNLSGISKPQGIFNVGSVIPKTRSLALSQKLLACSSRFSLQEFTISSSLEQ